jgi:hypothetical protein
MPSRLVSTVMWDVVKKIAEWEVESPADEWSEAKAFHDVQTLARETMKLKEDSDNAK